MENQIKWGPALWSILHHCTERIGTIPSNGNEEAEMWSTLLRHLQHHLPCMKCRVHYTAYYHKTGLPVVSREGVRRWLYDLHSDVNQRLGKPNMEYDALQDRYSEPFDCKQMIVVIKQQVNYAIRLKWSAPADGEKFIKELNHLRQFYQLS